MLISMMEKGCKVGFFGLGISGISLLEYLPLKNCKVTIRSDVDINWSAIPCGAKIERFFAHKSACEDICEDILIFSPSVRRDRPELIKARERGCLFTSDAEMFFGRNDRPVFAVTGSDGKSTTATLIHLLLKAGGINNEIIGNIGNPMLPSIEKADAYVAELSSFMLSYANPRVERGCITNITPNHLDWHESFEEYKETKTSLLKNSEKIVISDENTDIKGAFGIISVNHNFTELKKIYQAELYLTVKDGYIYKNGKRFLKTEKIKLQQRHNLKNLMMAIAMTDGYVGVTEIRSVASAFDGLEHRCKKITSVDGVDFYDSSIDSTPARTAQTLESLDRRVVILLGGRSKGVAYSSLLPTLKKYAEVAILVGENAEEIFEAVGNEVKCEIIPDFEAAVNRGAKLAKEVGALLLSPASTSYDKFKNYAERGDKFKQILINYTKAKTIVYKNT